MMFTRALLACALAAASAAASSQESAPTIPPSGALDALRGFHVGAGCEQQAHAYDELRTEGFNVAPARFVCLPTDRGRFRKDFLLRDAEGKQELIELSYAPDSTLWRVRVNLDWRGGARLNFTPSPSQVEQSLVRRFGSPFLSGRDGALVTGDPSGKHRISWAWANTPPLGEGPGIESDAWTWTRWNQDLKGVVTQATLVWSDNAPRQTLLVEMTDRNAVGSAAASQADVEQRRAAERTLSNQTMLGGL